LCCCLRALLRIRRSADFVFGIIRSVSRKAVKVANLRFLSMAKKSIFAVLACAIHFACPLRDDPPAPAETGAG